MEDYDGNHVPGTEDWELVAMASGGGWEWWEIQVCYSPGTQNYYWDEQAGCSCNEFEWFADNLPSPKSWRGVVRELRNEPTDYDDEFGYGPKASDIDRLVREVEKHARENGLR